jgi:hypothetical protein
VPETDIGQGHTTDIKLGVFGTFDRESESRDSHDNGDHHDQCKNQALFHCLFSPF